MVLALLALFFPACPSDGITLADPPVCVYDATGDNMSGKSFIATSTESVVIS